MTADFDKWLTEELPDDKYCELHGINYRHYCGNCLADEADRRHDEKKEVES
jgi:hypothetical protein